MSIIKYVLPMARLDVFEKFSYIFLIGNIEMLCSNTIREENVAIE